MNSRRVLNRYFTFFFYASLVFLVIYLFKYDYLEIRIDRLSYGFLGLSFLFLFLGFFLNAFCWYLVCEQLSQRVSLKDSIVSYGLTILGKYMPGKVWGLVGRATYVSRSEGSLKIATQLSFYTQFLSIWVGGGLGITGLISITPSAKYLWLILLLWVLVSATLLLPQEKLQSLLPFRQLSHPLNHVSHVVRNLPVFLLYWLCWTLAFCFLMESLFPDTSIKWYTPMAFPFAATLGIIAFIAPGGLGVRESFMVFYLVNSGMSLESSTVVSVASRLWFTVGEICIFIVAVCLKYNFPNKLIGAFSRNLQ